MYRYRLVCMYILMSLTMSKISNGYNTPPLSNRTSIYKPNLRISDADHNMYSMELRNIEWEHKDKDNPNSWGRLLADLNRDVKRLMSLRIKSK